MCAMVKGLRVAVFEGGKLRLDASGVKSREAVLALPLSRLLVKLVRVPVDGDAQAAALAALSEITPFPDEPLTVGIEKVCEDEMHQVVLASALPESSVDDIASALDEEKLSIVRVDALVLGELRGVWADIGVSGRKVVVFRTPDCLSLVVLQGDRPASIRAVPSKAELKREVMLSLLEAEDFCGAANLDEIVLVDRGDFISDDGEDSVEAQLSSFDVPVRKLKIHPDACFAGIAERSAEEGTLNALPGSWHDELVETRFKAKIVRYFAASCAVWSLVMAVLLGVPVVYGYMTDHQKDLCTRHARNYRAVSEKRAKVKLVQKYSDHSLGALEIMKAISDRLPSGVILSSWDFKRGEGVRIRGESDDSSSAYQLKDELSEMVGVDESGEEGAKIFEAVRLGALNKQKDGKQKFDLECLFTMPEGE